jgi:hypothetical protein
MAIKQYVGPRLGDFGTSGNWSPLGVPGTSDDAEININNGTPFVVVSEIEITTLGARGIIGFSSPMGLVVRPLFDPLTQNGGMS